MRVEPLKAVRGGNPLALPALFPGFLSPFIDKGQREEESSHFLFVCRLQRPAEGQGLLASWCVSVCVCVCVLVSNLCTQLNDPSLNNGHYLVFHLYQQDGLIDMGATAWVTATRHPPVNHL